jgi:hypothetical protein
MKTKTKKTLVWIAAAFLLAGIISACQEVEGSGPTNVEEITTLTIAPKTLVIEKGGSETFTAQASIGGEPVSASFTWKLSDAKSGDTKLEDGQLTVAADETAESFKVTAKATVSGKTVSRSATVTVSGNGGLTVSPGVVVIGTGNTQAFTAALSGGGEAGAVTWSLEDGTINDSTVITEGGELTVGDGETAGKLVVKATQTAGNKYGTAIVYVGDAPDDAVPFPENHGITVNPQQATVVKGQEKLFSQTGAASVTWSLDGYIGSESTIDGGLLSVGAGETAGKLVVKATGSGEASNKWGAAVVTVGGAGIGDNNDEGGDIIFISNPETSTGGGWTFDSESGVVTIGENGNYTITGTTTANRVVVAVGVTAGITLNNVSIDVSGETDACAFDMTGATVNLTLAPGSENTLKSNGTAAGLQAPEGATLTITSAAGAGSASGTLSAYGGLGTGEHSGAGIGGGQAQSGGAITISGGTINAYGFYDGSTNYPNAGAGLGGGGYDTSAGTPKAGDGGNITILGGAVTAVAGSSNTISGEGAAGIGGGSGKDGSDNSGGTGGVIQITGGTVIASSRINGAGIGGGCMGAGGSITIGGSAVVTATGGDRCPGIGSGFEADAGSANNISIFNTVYTGNGASENVPNRGNGEGSPLSTDSLVKTITIINNSSLPGQVISTSGGNTRVAIGEGDY